MAILLNKVVVLVATLDCNKNCPWCIRKKLNEEYHLSLDPMSIDTAEKILKKYNDTVQIVLTGGEPMTNMPLVEYVIKTGRMVKISTNGSIVFPDPSILSNQNVVFDISFNECKRPVLYQQLIDIGYPAQNIRVFTYFDKDYQKVLDIIDFLGNDPIRGYEILPDIWIPYDDEYEKLIIEAAPKFAEKHRLYNKDDGYLCYQYQDPVPVLKYKFDPQGNQIKDLWTQGMPEERLKEESGHIYDESQVMRFGRKNFHKKKSGFNVPVEYYTVLMYEEMEKCLT